MPKLSIDVPHPLGRDQALERMKGFLDRLKEKYQDRVRDLKGEWADNVCRFSFTTYGFGIKGELTVEETAVHFHGEIPFAAIMFRGQIESGIREELERALA